jgi:hypothetical protein
MTSGSALSHGKKRKETYLPVLEILDDLDQPFSKGLVPFCREALLALDHVERKRDVLDSRSQTRRKALEKGEPSVPVKAKGLGLGLGCTGAVARASVASECFAKEGKSVTWGSHTEADFRIYILIRPSFVWFRLVCMLAITGGSPFMGDSP